MLRHYDLPVDAGMWQRIRYGGAGAAVAFACGVSGNVHRYCESGVCWLRRILGKGPF